MIGFRLGFLCFLCSFFNASWAVTPKGDNRSSGKTKYVYKSEEIELSLKRDGAFVRFALSKPVSLDGEVSLVWHTGDGHHMKGANPAYVYASPGDYLVRLEIWDSKGLLGTKEQMFRLPSLSEEAELNWRLTGSKLDFRLVDLAAGTYSFVGIGQAGHLVVSNDGFHWEPVDPQIGEQLQSVVWAQGKFWAVAKGADFGRNTYYSVILTSTTGYTWRRHSQINHAVVRINHDGKTLMALGAKYLRDSHRPLPFRQPEPTLWTYGRGGAWEAQNIGFNGLAHHLYRTEAGYIVLGSESSQSGLDTYFRMFTSTNGETWEARSSEPFTEIVSNGELLVRINPNREGFETSDDGLNWQPIEISLPEPVKKLAWAQNHFVALGDNVAYRSADGFTWQFRPLPTSLRSDGIRLAAHNGVWIATDANGQMIWSNDGLNWQVHPLYQNISPFQTWNTVAATDKSFVVGGSHGALRESTNGKFWRDSSIIQDQHTRFDILAIEKGRFDLIAAGKRVEHDPGGNYMVTKGALYERRRGHWTLVHITEEPVSQVVYNQGRWLVLARDLVFSRNGSDWNIVPNIRFVDGIKWQDGLFIAHARTSFYTSSDGQVWNEYQAPVTAIHDVVRRDGQWLLAGKSNLPASNETTIFFSNNGHTWDAFQTDVPRVFEEIVVHSDRFYARARYTPSIANSIKNPSAPIQISNAGKIWNPDNPFPNLALQDIAAGSKGLISLGTNGSIFIRKY